MHFSRNTAISWQLNKLSIVLSAPIFHAQILKTLDNRYRDKYGMSMIENLRYIQTNGIKQFLEKEQERWKCLKCGKVVCVHNGKCYSCDTATEE